MIDESLFAWLALIQQAAFAVALVGMALLILIAAALGAWMVISDAAHGIARWLRNRRER